MEPHMSLPCLQDFDLSTAIECKKKRIRHQNWPTGDMPQLVTSEASRETVGNRIVISGRDQGKVASPPLSERHLFSNIQ
jgi:hypothetical protein